MATQKQYSLDLELSSSQYASIADGSQTGLDITGDFTLECWIKLEQLPSTAGANFHLISKYDSNGDQRSYRVFLEDTDKLYMQYSSDGTTSQDVYILSSSAIVTSADVGVWVHIAISVDVSGRSCVMYKNGVVVANGGNDGGTDTSIYDGTAPFVVGARTNAGVQEQFFDGEITEVRVWDDIRTHNEIITNMLRSVSGSATNLQGYWKLENDYTDETSNGNDLTASGSPTFASGADDVPFTYYLESGDNFASLDLELSSSQYASIADASQTGLDITGDFTIEGWVKLEQLPSTAGSSMVLAGKYEINDQRAYMVWTSSANDALYIQWNSDGTATTNTQWKTDSAFFVSGDVGTWVHFAATLDVSAKTGVVYKNGSTVASSLVSGSSTSIANTTADFAIGMRLSSGTPGDFLDGKIDNVRVWNDIRTATEIRENMFVEVPTSTTNMQGCWLFNADYTDESSNGNDLTASNSPVFSADWGFDEAINRHSLDLESGSSQYLSIPNGSHTNLNFSGDITIETWVKFESTPSSGNSMNFCAMRDGSDNRAPYLLQLSNNGGTLQLSFFHRNQSDQTDNEVVDWTPSTGVWYHIACVVDGSDVKFYVDGSQQGSTQTLTNARATDASADFTISSTETTTPGAYLDGQLDEFRIWSDVRTSGEISANYNKLLNGDEANLVAYWRLDNNYADLTSNGNTLLSTTAKTFVNIVPYDGSGGVIQDIIQPGVIPFER